MRLTAFFYKRNPLSPLSYLLTPLSILPLVLKPYRQHQIDKVLAVLGQELDGA